MGNLGLYLWLTRAAKKFGGPIPFLGFVFAVGSLVGLGLTKAVEALAKAVKKNKVKIESEPVYTMNQDVVGEDGTGFKSGDQFVILVRDGDYALLERVRDEEHHIMQVSILADVSDYVPA